MSTQNGNKWTLHFTLWGIPVEIQPSSWVVLALLGGAFGISDGNSLIQVLIFVAAGMLCILAHEFGHVLVMRKFTGLTSSITVAMLGATSSVHASARTRKEYFLWTLAGPVGGLIPGLAAALLLGLQAMAPLAGFSFLCCSPFGISMPTSAEASMVEAIRQGYLSITALQIYATVMSISVWWTIFNLLPILPMDGGHLLETATNNRKLTTQIGMVLAGALALLSISAGMWFGMLIMGYFAYINWQIYQSVR